MHVPLVHQGYKVLSNGSLFIESAEIRNAGIYVCIAQNTAGTALNQIRLEVQGWFYCDSSVVMLF